MNADHETASFIVQELRAPSAAAAASRRPSARMNIDCSWRDVLCAFAAVGCTDPTVPRGASMRRSGDKAAISCNATSQSWHIICQGSQWLGKVDNCTVAGESCRLVWRYTMSWLNADEDAVTTPAACDVIRSAVVFQLTDFADLKSVGARFIVIWFHRFRVISKSSTRHSTLRHSITSTGTRSQ